MAQISYEEFMKFNQKSEKKDNLTRKPRTYVRYFGLGDDGDTGIVRFNVGTLDDIKIVSKHRVKNSDGKIRNIACLRTSPDQALDVCPLCAAGEKMTFRAYVPLISYEQDENGNTVPVPCLWEQSPRIRETLKSFTVDYGDLRDYIFKIVRHGKHGDTNTTYTILPANPTVYKEEIFKKDFTGFENLDFERFVTTKTADEMNEFLETGDFPNPFERKDGQSEPRVMEETVKQEEQRQPVQDQGFNRLRSSQPIRSTFNTQKQEEQPKQQGIRRYTY